MQVEWLLGTTVLVVAVQNYLSSVLGPRPHTWRKNTKRTGDVVSLQIHLTFIYFWQYVKNWTPHKVMTIASCKTFKYSIKHNSFSCGCCRFVKLKCQPNMKRPVAAFCCWWELKHSDFKSTTALIAQSGVWLGAHQMPRGCLLLPWRPSNKSLIQNAQRAQRLMKISVC